jgi:hypothetical protein
MMARMRVTHRVRYDAPVTEVRAMLTDPGFREQATLTMGAAAVSVRIEGDAVRIEMSSQSHHIPAFVRPVVGDSVRARHAEDWVGDEAAFTITSGRVPAGLRGRRALVADADGCLDTFDGEAYARIPFVGGRIERLIADRLVEGWDIEHGVGVTWLGARGGMPGRA